MRIAVVDDNAEDRKELASCLGAYMQKNRLDYTLSEFEDAEDFLRAAEQICFQLVFMDIYMNGMDGIETAKRLRQKNRQCRLVFLTITEDYVRMGYSLNEKISLTGLRHFRSCQYLHPLPPHFQLLQLHSHAFQHFPFSRFQ